MSGEKRRMETVMSDARERARKDYRDDPESDTQSLGQAFEAGWDAAKADLPDRETLAALEIRIPYTNKYLLLGDAGADAVLSLLRGETNNG